MKNNKIFVQIIKWKTKNTCCQNSSKIKYQNRRKRKNRYDLTHKYMQENM